METKTIPSRDVILFDQDEVRETREISTKLTQIASLLSSMVNGAERTKTEVKQNIGGILELKVDIEVFFARFLPNFENL